jgi:hypothetical protein
MTAFWMVRCPHCGGGWEYSPRTQAMCSSRFTKEHDPEADEIARRNGVPLRAPRGPAPDPVPGVEWGEATCAGCGARKRHWADSLHGRCSRCGTPLGEPPAAPPT